MGSIWLYGGYTMSTKFDWQGKRKEQVDFSMMMCSICFISMFVLIFLSFLYKLVYWLF